MEDLCRNCLDLRHHSGFPCEKKERKEAVQCQETLSTPDHSPQLTVPMPMGKTLDKETPPPVVEKNVPKELPKSENKEAVQSQETLSTLDHSPQLAVPMPMGKTVGKETMTPVIEMSKPKESPKLSYRDALKKGSVQSQDTSKTPDYSPQFVTLMPRGKTLAKETHPPATSSRPRKSYEQRKEEYAQARLRILGSSERTKESPKGSWMNRVQNYIHGIRKKEPP